MSSEKPTLVQMWNAFSNRFELIIEEVTPIQNDQLILVKADIGSIQAVFEYEGHFEEALAERGMKLLRRRDTINIFAVLEIARLNFDPA